ncbi:MULTISPECIES: Cof-type HAD-IIB family hydrolase [Paenibacillus]|uniref:Cof-type HAD-IIB family hydrolase n=1 Tax=Paenibacillus TaxID=44249 RepID=UPI00119CC4B8|nr:Cof-type HAD-IIB family hydrolase [Paenibacillus sp. Y412MC10]
MYEIVFCDVDGTLLSEIDRTLLNSTRESINKLHDKGIKVAIATGRPHNLCEELMELGIDTIISANGALVKSGNNVIHKSLLSAETVRDLSEFAQINGHSISYFTDVISMNGLGAEDDRVKKALKETLGLTLYPEKIALLLEEIYCICLYADESEAQKFIDYFPSLRFERFHNYVLNVLEQTDVSKLTAIKKVLDHYKIDKANAIAFGDGGNDIEMIEYVGMGIAMGNSVDKLKMKANFVTKKASEDGIHYALSKFGII